MNQKIRGLGTEIDKTGTRNWGQGLGPFIFHFIKIILHLTFLEDGYITDIRQSKRTNQLQEIILNLNTKNAEIYIFLNDHAIYKDNGKKV